MTLFVALGVAARRGTVGGSEARVFHAINRLPAGLHPPVWAVMQAGSLAGVGVAGAAAFAGGQRELGGRLAAAGTVTWGLAKVVKHAVRRGRPSTTLETWRELGRPQSGLGYPSGHAAVAATLATVALPEIAPRWRPVVLASALVPGLSRIYVGAHLPLDVAGGLGLGYAIGVLGRRPA